MNRVITGIGALFAFAIVYGLANVMAAKDAIESNSWNVITGTATNEFELVIHTTNNVFVVGGRIELQMELRNISSNTLAVKVQDGLMNYSFHVIGKEGNEVPLTEKGNEWLHPVRLYHQSVEILASGQTFSQLVPLEQMFALTNEGEYTIDVSRDTYDKHVSACPLTIHLMKPTSY